MYVQRITDEIREYNTYPIPCMCPITHRLSSKLMQLFNFGCVEEQLLVIWSINKGN